ncbi:hypothetical protein [Haloarcula halophila]|uniref:hypothetical protein n=1 Tax=Haloarcula TaxID=2237 RepID=UPI0023E44F45|nr:hypothetical protein [Halomicroarcula sp. DFY41]
MADESETTEAKQGAEETTQDTGEEAGAVLDADAATSTQSTDELREMVDEQQKRIEELEDLLLDLSTRVADGNNMGVCPDCHGAVIKVNPWFRSAKIKCTQCQRVFHEY